MENVYSAKEFILLMVFNVLITCVEKKRDRVIERLKEFKDIKNIQQRKEQNQLQAEIHSNDAAYVKNDIVNRINAMEDVTDASLY